VSEFGTIFYQKRIVANVNNITNYLALTYAMNGMGATIVPIFSKDCEAIETIYCKTKAIAYITDNTEHLKSEFLNSKSIDELTLLVESNHEYIAREDNDEAMIIYTSGTTGIPKGVILGNDGISHITTFMNNYMKVDDSISEMVVAPLDHAFGFGRCHAVLKTGGQICVGPSKLDIRLIQRLLTKKQINALSIMPSILTKIVDFASKHFAPIANNLNWLQTGAMKFELEDRIALCDLFPNTAICLHFGMSESMRTTFINLNDEPDKRHTEGKASEGVELAIVDEDKNILPANTEGRLVTKGKNFALGYVDHEIFEKNIHDGWFLSNDMALLDSDGYLHYKGRVDDVINLNGLLIHPDEVEVILKPVLSDHIFCIAGIEDPKKVRDKVIALFVESKVDEKINIGYLSQKWGDQDRHLLPSHIFWLDEFPRTKSGKVIRAKLYDLVE
tara:strand:+ start:13084 stop:14418 length:1335 start_codon:yes stop_codon:yes gene_type:complete